MTNEEAIKVIKVHYPTENYTRLREALDLAIRILQEDIDFIEKRGNKMNIKKLEDNLEFISEKVHDSWQEEKLNQGFHAPLSCESSNRKGYLSAHQSHKERFDEQINEKFYKWCDKCHIDLYPYQQLSENVKEYDRVTVRTVLNAIKEL